MGLSGSLPYSWRKTQLTELLKYTRKKKKNEVLEYLPEVFALYKKVNFDSHLHVY